MLSTIFSGWDDLIVILVALVVLFGGTQLPKLARNTGEALREFRKSHSDAASDNPPANAAASAPVAPASPAALPASTPVSGTAAATTAPAPSDSVTLTQAELDALVAERVRSQAEGPKAGS